MSDNDLIQFIHETRTLRRKWNNLTREQKEKILSALNGEIDEKAFLKTMRKVKREEQI